jgi:protein TonB
VIETSGHTALDEAALRIVTLMQFEPDRGEKWVMVPVTFTPPGGAVNSDRGRSLAAIQPTFTPFTVAPTLKNSGEIAELLDRNYPPLLRNAGIGGTTRLWFFIDEDGNVLKTEVKASSGHEALDEAATSVAHAMKFSPALNRDQKTRVWVDLPIVFKPKQ